MAICRPCRGTGYTILAPCPFCRVSGVSQREAVEIVSVSHSRAGTVQRAAMVEEAGADPFAAWDDCGSESGGA